MELPDYKGASIANLMSTIVKSRGGKHTYPELKLLKSKKLKTVKNVVLIVLDGFGYEYLKKYGKGSIFLEHLKGKMTSVFPSTTAAAAMTFSKGYPPQQHALTGWFMHLKEMGCISAILPFMPLWGGEQYSKQGIERSKIDTWPFVNKFMKTKHYEVYPKKIIKRDYKNGTKHGLVYSTLTGFFRRTKEAIAKPGKKLVYSYWPDFDMYCHLHGIKSKTVKEHFWELDKKLKTFFKAIKGTNTIVIITADHGLIDAPKSKIVYLKKHPKLYECLSMPLTGEPRAAYCYVKAAKTKQFEKYVKTKLKKYCTLKKSENIIKKGYFGLGKPSPALYDRVGDYVLIMKENYTISNLILGESRNIHAACHGGTSKEEMHVPLIVYGA